MSEIYLIRHAQAGPRQSYDTLSELGERQARLLGQTLAAQGLRFDAALSGGLQRQRRTGEHVVRAFAEAGLPFPDLAVERAWDEFDLAAVYAQVTEPLARDDEEFARRWAEMTREIGDAASPLHRRHTYCDIAAVRAWVSGRYRFEGETWPAFRDRIHAAFEALERETPRGTRIAVFTSATPVGLSVGRALGLDETEVWRLAGATYNSSITVLRVDGEGRARLAAFNAAPHLLDPALWSVR